MGSNSAGRGLLGSSLWLRPLEPGDLANLENFWERRDLVRTRGAAGTLLPGLGRLVHRSGTANHPSTRLGLVFGAFDQGGDPVGLFGLVRVPRASGDPSARRRGRVSVTVGREDGARFSEGMRLLMDWARRHTRLDGLQIQVPRGARSMQGLLEAMGWRSVDEESWEYTLPGGRGAPIPDGVEEPGEN